MLELKAAERFMDTISTLRIAGNARALADLFTEDATFSIHGLGETVNGREAIHTALANLIEAYEFLEYTTIKLFVEGDDIALRRKLKLHYRPNGTVVETETAEFLTLKNGLCSHFIQYIDSAMALGLVQAK